MKLKKKVSTITASVLLAVSFCSAIPASAKSLADSFSSSVSINYDRPALTGDYWNKSCTASTNGYYKRHYVRAYIGGNNDGPGDNAWADTGRCYSNGDISKTATTDSVFVSSDGIPRLSFPTAYAKYGN